MPFPIRVGDVMSTPLQTIIHEATPSEAARICVDSDINSLVILDDGEMVGIVTGTDLLDQMGSPDDVADVQEIMSSPAETIAADQPLHRAVEQMFDHDIARLVVIDQDEEPIGMVTTDDIVRHAPQIIHREWLRRERTSDYQYRVRRETSYEREDWEYECFTCAEDLPKVGDRAVFSKTLSEEDVRQFAEASGDTNRLHLDETYAQQTRFGHRIAHGTLVGGLISAALARLPGVTIYLSQDLTFHQAVAIGERLTAICEVVDSFDERKFELTTDVENEVGDTVIEGQAVVLVDESPEAADIVVEALA